MTLPIPCTVLRKSEKVHIPKNTEPLWFRTYELHLIIIIIIITIIIIIIIIIKEGNFIEKQNSNVTCIW